ncbi:MAG: Rieske 2Fe-2S domain-containing protein [Burkholderiaceae bacterium]
MSKALTYLVKARPEALGHYLAFMKEAGRSLDPKTRNLISVITKVHAQTERGLRQYLNRALREGCTPNEVLDALLMAFPALGLAKIVWAIDVILAMDLPGFDLDALEARPDWHDLGAADDFEPAVVTRLECDGRAVFVRRDGGSDDIAVYDSLCPHQGTNIPELALQGDRLVCPKHGWTFDVTTGACVDKGDQPLRRHPSRIEDGRLQAHW